MWDTATLHANLREAESDFLYWIRNGVKTISDKYCALAQDLGKVSLSGRAIVNENDYTPAKRTKSIVGYDPLWAAGGTCVCYDNIQVMGSAKSEYHTVLYGRLQCNGKKGKGYMHCWLGGQEKVAGSRSE